MEIDRSISQSGPVCGDRGPPYPLDRFFPGPVGAQPLGRGNQLYRQKKPVQASLRMVLQKNRWRSRGPVQKFQYRRRRRGTLQAAEALSIGPGPGGNPKEGGPSQDRKSVVKGKRVDLGGRRVSITDERAQHTAQ